MNFWLFLPSLLCAFVAWLWAEFKDWCMICRFLYFEVNCLRAALIFKVYLESFKSYICAIFKIFGGKSLIFTNMGRKISIVSEPLLLKLSIDFRKSPITIIKFHQQNFCQSIDSINSINPIKSINSINSINLINSINSINIINLD